MAFLTRRLKTQKGASASAIAQSLRTFLARATNAQSIPALHDGLGHGVNATTRVADVPADALATLLTANGGDLGFLRSLPLRKSLTAPDEVPGQCRCPDRRLVRDGVHGA